MDICCHLVISFFKKWERLGFCIRGTTSGSRRARRGRNHPSSIRPADIKRKDNPETSFPSIVLEVPTVGPPHSHRKGAGGHVKGLKNLAALNLNCNQTPTSFRRPLLLPNFIFRETTSYLRELYIISTEHLNDENLPTWESQVGINYSSQSSSALTVCVVRLPIDQTDFYSFFF